MYIHIAKTRGPDNTNKTMPHPTLFKIFIVFSFISHSKKMVPEEGFEPSHPFGYQIFVTHCFRIRALDFLFTISFDLGALPSSLYTFLFLGLARDCHAKGFPEFESVHLYTFIYKAQLNKSDESAISPLRRY